MKRRLLNTKKGGFNFNPDLVAYWKLATNSLDYSTGGNVAYEDTVTYSGGYADFNTGYIRYNDNDKLSFTDGVNDLKAHILLSFIYDDKTGSQFFITRRLTSPPAESELQINSNGSTLNLTISSLDFNDRITIRIPLTSITTGILNTIQFSYDGSKLHTGLKAYLNGNNPIGTTETAGTYTGTNNTTVYTSLGVPGWNNANPFKGKGKEWAIWRDREMTPEEITEIDRRVKAGEPLI